MQVYAIEGQNLRDPLPFPAVSLDVHRSLPDFFLVAHDSGLVALHHSSRPFALRVWACREGICAVRWLPGIQSQFVVVHVDGAIALADCLSESPVVKLWAQVSDNFQASSACTCSMWDQGSVWLAIMSTLGEVQLHRIPKTSDTKLTPQDMERQLLHDRLDEHA
jgi:hypothetical protein